MVIGLGLAENLVRTLVTAGALTVFGFFIQPNLQEILGRTVTPQDYFIYYLSVLIMTLAVSTILISVLAARTESN